MDYNQATRYLISLGNEVRAATADGVQAAKFGLENISVLLEELGRPQDAFPSVLIAGTNGKGSVAAMLEAVLRRAGLRTGLYSSPHLVEINERIRLGGEPIPPADFAAVFTALRAKIERLLANGRLRFHPTYFECLTAMAMEYFREQRCEFAVLEVGMGGRLDATNTATPRLSIITQIDFDHERFLGTTIPAIAAEKAGIIKPGGMVVSTASHPQAAAAIRRKAGEENARLVEVWKEYAAEDREAHQGLYRFVARHGDGLSLPVKLSLRGIHQVENALAVIAASRELSRLGFPVVTERSIQEGLATAEWPGRLELVREAPQVFLDGAHNPAGARALARFWEEEFPSRRIILVYGAMRDKAVPEIAETLFPKAAAVVLTQPEQSRAVAPETIRDVSQHLNRRILIEPSPAKALERALALAHADDVVFATGSLFLVGDLKRRCFQNAAPHQESLPVSSLSQ
jgi:dihydrofolate synthase/folylpolyglutamate synthase